MKWSDFTPDQFATACPETALDWAEVNGKTLPSRNWEGYGRRLRQAVLNDPVTVDELATASKCLVQMLDCRGLHSRAPGFNYHALGRWMHKRLVDGLSRAEVRALMETQTPPVPPMTYGDWKGNFMYSVSRPHPAGGEFEGYFGPAQHAFGRQWTETYLTDQAAEGHKDVLIEALDRYWGQHSHPKAWGRNFDAFESQADRDHLAWTVTRARQLGLRPHILMVDRYYLEKWTFDRMLGWCRELAEEYRGQVTAYIPTWESDEPWGVHDYSTDWTDKLYEVNDLKLIEAIHKIDPDVTIAEQHANGNRGSLEFFERAGPLNGAHYMQYNRQSSPAVLRDETRQVADRCASRGMAFCVFEHSAPRHVSTQPAPEAKERHRVCMEAAQPIVPRLPRFGYMNGW